MGPHYSRGAPGLMGPHYSRGAPGLMGPQYSRWAPGLMELGPPIQQRGPWSYGAGAPTAEGPLVFYMNTGLFISMEAHTNDDDGKISVSALKDPYPYRSLQTVQMFNPYRLSRCLTPTDCPDV